jgi:hypothetical protein
MVSYVSYMRDKNTTELVQGACDTRGSYKKLMQYFNRKTWKKESILEI